MKFRFGRFSFLILIFYFTLLTSSAQDLVEIKGTILREDSLSPIYGAVIFNRNSLLGTLSNKLGNFKMRVKTGDTIQITHLGFISHFIVFNNANISPDERLNIIMKIRSYELPEIDVRRYRIRDRKQPTVTMRRTDNITYDAGPIRFQSDGAYYLNPWSAAGANSMAMPSFGIPIGDWNAAKREKQYAKVREEEAKDKKKKFISRKYSRDLVNRLTGLKGNELENFMNFCRPSEDIIMRINEYDLTNYILQCYDKFKLENE
jgi:hypothetical protein